MHSEQPDAASGERGSGANSQLVLAELERVLRSPAFVKSKRSQEFLRHIVENTLEGRSDHLKERLIGMALFDRSAAYDTGEDSIVRVKASELRKRLAQFYHEAPRGEVEIELPAGSYVPEFKILEARFPASQPPSPARPQRRFAGWLPVAAVVLLVPAVMLAWFSTRHTTPNTPLDEFWGPVYKSTSPVLLCVANPVVYTVQPPTRDLLEGTRLPELVSTRDLVRDPDQFVGMGDAFTLAQVSGHLRSKGKDVRIRIGDDVAFAELRHSPTVLIGAFTNPWTLEMTKNLRYVFDKKDPISAIRDRLHPEQAWHYPGERAGWDYVLISRVFDSRSGNLVITAAGLGHVGTEMSGEFLTQPEYMQELVRNAPADWQHRNVQIVLSGEIIGKTVGPPKVVASWFW